jgi:hypothetical protein
VTWERVNLQVKAIDFFLINIFRTRLQPYLRLATTSMMKNTLIKHKEVILICEENGLVVANYNALIIQPKSKPIAQPIIAYHCWTTFNLFKLW